MSVIAEFTAGDDDFVVGRALAVSHGSTVDLERIVPIDDGLFPYCRVRGEADPAAFAETVAANPAVQSVVHVPDADDGELYHVTWTGAAVDDLLKVLVEHEGQVLAASARAGRWRFRLRFPSTGLLADFQRTTTAADLPLEVGRVYAATESLDPEFGLTTAQVDALVTAVETGYFRVPRGISTADLGVLLGISDQAVSERIRRGVETLARNALNVDERRRNADR
ncbi:bacterio-opsin activator domain-containing protein [Halorubellus sp. PRR65]|uniref:bacterio-opsin activator domain-containing protein n=1 Tax=Halorubellus sp. PRR65 TaxID=3098148 RepID=UPI002B25A05B|nr:bacterio-opsin activator domain-containing protein [Halorubellus sp. PRR65]